MANYVSSQAAYAALMTQKLNVASQTSYAALLPAQISASSMTAYAAMFELPPATPGRRRMFIP